MSRIQEVFGKPDHTALIAYLTVGYPDIETTLKAVPVLAENGCDIIELGIPFSDPLADGVTIQNASYHALLNGVTVTKCIGTAAELRKQVEVPLVFMTYYNPVYHYGIEKFSGDCAAAGIDGLIVPDLPPEEGTALESAMRADGLDLVYLLAPTSTEARIRQVGARASGFVYMVSVTGITGARESLPADLEAFVGRVRKSVNLPLCVGFGISTPEQAAQVGKIADGVIVGSRIIQLIEEDPSMKKVAELVRGMRAALDG